jgi:hypothetical protein
MVIVAHVDHHGAKPINEKRCMDLTLTHRHQNQTKGQETWVNKIHRYFAKLDFGYIDDEKLLGWTITISRHSSCRM